MRHVLRTGQMRCYDRTGRVVPCPGTGQDGEHQPGLPWPAPRFLRRGAVVEDRLTGLWWPRAATACEWPLPWEECLQWLAERNREGWLDWADWRMPNRRELRSLIGHQTRDPALPAGHPFTGVFLSWYWTSTTAARNRAYAWYVHLEGGRMFFGEKSEDHLVWPCRGSSPVLAQTGESVPFDRDGVPVSVRGADGDLRQGVSWPEPRFEVRGEAVDDLLTGLRWSRDADLGAGLSTWEEAFDVVARASSERLGGIADWRLPTINELESLVDARCCDPALPAGHPFRGAQDSYWSSTSSAYEPDWCMALHLDRGAVGVGQKKGRTFSIWAVAGTTGPEPA